MTAKNDFLIALLTIYLLFGLQGLGGVGVKPPLFKTFFLSEYVLRSFKKKLKARINFSFITFIPFKPFRSR